MTTMYRVEGGVAHIGAGTLLQISEEQLRSRAHNIDVVQVVGDKGGVIVRAKTQLEFMEGELVGLPDGPPMPFAHLFKSLADEAAAAALAEEARKAEEAAVRAAAKAAAKDKAARKKTRAE